MRINIDNLLNKIIYLFPVITLIQGIPWLGLIGKVAMGGIILMLLMKIIKPKITSSTALVVFLSIICYVFAILNTTFPLVNFNDLFYYILWILYFIFVVWVEAMFVLRIKSCRYLQVFNIISSLIMGIFIAFNVYVSNVTFDVPG